MVRRHFRPTHVRSGGRPKLSAGEDFKGGPSVALWTGGPAFEAGEPDSYKSWLVLCLGRSVAEGAPFLERACPKLPVLYLDRENPQAVVRERMQVLGIRSAERLRVWGGWLVDPPASIDQEDGQERGSPPEAS